MKHFDDIPGLFPPPRQAPPPASGRRPGRPAQTPRPLDTPRPGFWLIKLTPGGVAVPARIFRHTTDHEPGNPDNVMERPLLLYAEILGNLVRLDRVWLRSGREIDADEYEFQMRDFAHAAHHRPADPKAAPKKRVDLTLIPPVY